MHGLLASLWLAPKQPNWADNLFGKWAEQASYYDNAQGVALWVGMLMFIALVWRHVRAQPQLAKELKVDEQTALWGNRVLTGALVCLALLSSVNYFYGTRNNGVYLHRWDAFHTVMGAKYHSELGYFDLYKCSYALDREGPRHFTKVDKIRDLRTRKFVAAREHIANNDCKQRFTPERLEEFRHDLDEFGTWSNRKSWRKLFKDKGFNGTPFYATVSKVLASSVEVELDSLRRLAYIDPFLMMVGFAFVGWAFGLRKAAIVALCFTTFFPNRYEHMGGSILRYDYVAALLIGFSAIKKDRWGLAGALFAWATMVRVFPAIFAVGVGAKIAADVAFDREIRTEHKQFVAWFAGGVALLFVISLIGMDGGFDNWRTWKTNIDIHNQTSAGYRVGFKHLFMLDGKLTASNYVAKQENFEARSHYYWLAVLALYGPVLASVRRLDTISFAAIFGVFGFFLLAVATRYYWGVLALIFLVDRKLLDNRYMLMIGALVFYAAAFDYFYFRLNDSSPLMYNTIIGLQLTALCALLSSWLLFNPSLLELGHDARVPAHVPARLGAVAEPVPLAKKKKKKKKKKKSGESSTDASASVDSGDAEEDDAVVQQPSAGGETRRLGPVLGPGELGPDEVTIRYGDDGPEPDEVTLSEGELVRSGALRAVTGPSLTVDADAAGSEAEASDEPEPEAP